MIHRAREREVNRDKRDKREREKTHKDVQSTREALAANYLFTTSFLSSSLRLSLL
jgi:hypothetical protein